MSDLLRLERQLPRVESISGPTRDVDSALRHLTLAVQSQERLVSALCAMDGEIVPSNGTESDAFVDTTTTTTTGLPTGGKSIHLHDNSIAALTEEANAIASRLWGLRMRLQGTGPSQPVAFNAIEGGTRGKIVSASGAGAAFKLEADLEVKLMTLLDMPRKHRLSSPIWRDNVMDIVHACAPRVQIVFVAVLEPLCTNVTELFGDVSATDTEANVSRHHQQQQQHVDMRHLPKLHVIFLRPDELNMEDCDVRAQTGHYAHPLVRADELRSVCLSLIKAERWVVALLLASEEETLFGGGDAKDWQELRTLVYTASAEPGSGFPACRRAFESSRCKGFSLAFAHKKVAKRKKKNAAAAVAAAVAVAAADVTAAPPDDTTALVTSMQPLLKERSDSSLADLEEACVLLFYAHKIVKTSATTGDFFSLSDGAAAAESGRGPSTSRTSLLDPSDALELAACAAASDPRTAFLNLATRQVDALDTIAATTDTVSSLPLLPSKSFIAAIERWLKLTLARRLGLVPASVPWPAPSSELASLIARLGPPVASLNPFNILAFARCGSYAYGLSTASSDEDYVFVHAGDTADLLSKLGYKTRESRDNNGPRQLVEHKVIEARLYCTQLLKGATNAVELLFDDSSQSGSPLWAELVAYREAFISEIVVRQYVGFVRDHLHRVERAIKSATASIKPSKSNNEGVRKGKGSNGDDVGGKAMTKDAAAGGTGSSDIASAGGGAKGQSLTKLLYHVFRALHELERMAAGRMPEVTVTGPDRDFILNLRSQSAPAVTPFALDSLVSLAKFRLQAVLGRLAQRVWRWPETGDCRWLENWLCRVRAAAYI